MEDIQPKDETNKSAFSTKSFVKRIEKPWGFELHFVPETSRYMTKILHINMGKRISLQRHNPGETSTGKVETYVLHSGKGKVIWENEQGEMIETELEQGKGYTTVVGQIHRLVAAKDSDVEIFESSLPEGDGDTERLEDDYGRPDETAEMRQDPNRGWNPNQ